MQAENEHDEESMGPPSFSDAVKKMQESHGADKQAAVLHELVKYCAISRMLPTFPGEVARWWTAVGNYRLDDIKAAVEKTNRGENTDCVLRRLGFMRRRVAVQAYYQAMCAAMHGPVMTIADPIGVEIVNYKCVAQDQIADLDAHSIERLEEWVREYLSWLGDAGGDVVDCVPEWPYQTLLPPLNGPHVELAWDSIERLRAEYYGPKSQNTEITRL